MKFDEFTEQICYSYGYAIVFILPCLLICFLSLIGLLLSVGLPVCQKLEIQYFGNYCTIKIVEIYKIEGFKNSAIYLMQIRHTMSRK